MGQKRNFVIFSLPRAQVVEVLVALGYCHDPRLKNALASLLDDSFT